MIRLHSVRRGLILAAAVVAVSLAGARTSSANVVFLDFEGLQNQEAILNFYNGGTGSLGSSGPNIGVTFSPNALGLIDADAPGGTGNFANEPSPSTIMFFLSGGATTMNFAAGFDTGFSFFYTAISQPGTVTVYDGLNGTGNQLAMLNLPVTPSLPGQGDPNGAFNNWRAVGVNFNGTARSVDFGGSLDQIGFDNITFGSATPVVPEPSTLALSATGLIGTLLGLRRFRRRRAIA